MIPGGSEPAAKENVYGGTPPLAVNPNGTTGTPAGEGAKTGAVIESGASEGFTGRLSSAAVTATLPTESVTETVNVNVPEVVGVPEITPVTAEIDRPGGRAPLAILHVYGGTPPVALNAAEV